MKVNFINYAWCNPLIKNSPQNTPKYNTKYLSLPKDTVSFQQSSDVPPEVLAYLEQRKKMLGKSYDTLGYYNYKKLEGIQNGIKIFEGLSFPQIAYLTRKLTAVVLQRGCSNACIHCFAEALTPYHMKLNNYADKIDFEDYKNLCDGFKELKERLGFNPFSEWKNDYQVLFHDSDCSMIYLEDKNGNIYDYADLAKMLHDVTGRKILFDTAGWNLNDKKTQERMEDLVKKIVNSNEYDFLEFNISLNPFHSIYNRSVELQNEEKAEGNKEKINKAQKLKDLYIDRMANVIFTFSPLIDKTNSINEQCQLSFIRRALWDNTALYGYREYDNRHLGYEILHKLEDMYNKDLMSECPKVVKTAEQKERYLNYAKEKFLEHQTSGVAPCNEKLLKKLEGIPTTEYSIIRNNTYKSAYQGAAFTDGLIDLNGNFYMTNYVETYPTNITLNYKNKGNSTAPIEPNLRDDIITIK